MCKIVAMAPMEKNYYIITWRLAFFELLRASNHPSVDGLDEPQLEKILVAITQGGFRQDGMDDTVPVKERFINFACQEYDLDLSPTVETFNEYFELVEPDYFVDLDEES